MALIKPSKNLPACFALGVFCFIYGVARGFIEDIITPIELALFLISFACLATCYLSFKAYQPTFPSKNKLIKKEPLGWTLIFMFVVYVGINWIGAMFPLTFDATSYKQHTLSQSTVLLTRSLKQDIRLTALYVGLAPKYLEDLLKQYESVSGGKISFEIIDPLRDIGYASRFGQVIKGEEKKLIVQAGASRQDVDFTNELLDEELINNALMRVSRPARRACFLTGHGEYRLFDQEKEGLNTLAQLLAANNIVPQEFSIPLIGAVPDGCDVIVAAGPRENYSPEEEVIIQNYLSNGGDALFLIENTLITTPDVPLREDQLDKNPSLNSILANWGLRVNPDIVVDLSSHAAGDVGSPATRNYPQHKAIVSGLDYTFYVRPRSISVLSDRRKTLKIAPLVMTASGKNSWGETNRMLDVKFDDILDRAGPIPIAFVIWERKTEKENSDTRIAVFTDADFCSNGYISQLNNAQMALNVINWLTEMDFQFSNVHKDVKVEEIHLVSKQKRIVIVILWLIPCLIATFGIMKWLRQID